VNGVKLNGWLRGWKAVGIIAGALISAGVVIGYVGRVVGQASARAVGQIVTQQLANDSTRSFRADARTLSKINEIASRQAKLEQRLNRQDQALTRTNKLVRNTLRSVLQKPTAEEKKRLLASVGVDTSAKAAPHP
jgi:alkylated DNA nucleotide flippase Atl1